MNASATPFAADTVTVSPTERGDRSVAEECAGYGLSIGHNGARCVSRLELSGVPSIPLFRCRGRGKPRVIRAPEKGDIPPVFSLVCFCGVTPEVSKPTRGRRVHRSCDRSGRPILAVITHKVTVPCQVNPES